MKLPSREKCLALLEKHGANETIIKHSMQVSRVAVFLAKKLKAAGEKVDIDLVERASLLHDIDKRITLDNSALKHAEEAKKILEKEGLPGIGAIVAKHRLSHILHGTLDSWEEKLVYYADKRVKHDKIVSLEERFDYLLERYGSLRGEVKQGILAAKPKVFALEREILSKAKADVSLGELK